MEEPVWGFGTIEKAEWLISLHTRSPDIYPRKLVAIGSGFVVGQVANCRIGLSAAHVFDDVIKKRMRRNPGLSYRQAKKALIAERSFKVFMESKSGATAFCPVGHISSYTPWDVSMFLIEEPEQGWPSPLSIIQVDTRVPKVGAEVAIAGFGQMFDTEAQPLGQDVHAWVFGRRSEFRTGRIVEVMPNGSTLVKGPCFRTDIPIDSGMSGAPILDWSESRTSRMTALGMVSSSMAGEHRLGLPGDSTAVMLAPALPLSFTIQFTQETVTRTLQQLMAERFVADRDGSGDRYEVTFPQPDGVRVRSRRRGRSPLDG